MRLRWLWLLPLAIVGLSACGPTAADDLTVEVIRQLPHDPGAFTQGLEFDGDDLFESTGLVGRSSLREVDAESGEVIRVRPIPEPLFAEGLTVVGNELLQLTYRAGRLLRWDKTTFEPTGEARYEGEGWGLCFDGEALWMSDGSSRLTRRDPVTFEVTSRLDVRRAGKPVPDLNELECVDDLVYANVWQTDQIVVIDAGSGQVKVTIDASPLWDRLSGVVDPGAVLNGIAYDAERDLFLVTGKLWPSAFEVRFVPQQGDATR
ncbi:MAG TPA: glutaminyl-peptide cyclotransferase [Trueperaceae bacterium]